MCQLFFVILLSDYSMPVNLFLYVCEQEEKLFDVTEFDQNIVEKDIDIPEYFEIEADVTDFSLGMTMTLASANLLDALDLDIDTEEIADKLHELTDGADKLQDGTQQLKDGTLELKDGADKLYDGTKELKDGKYVVDNIKYYVDDKKLIKEINLSKINWN